MPPHLHADGIVTVVVQDANDAPRFASLPVGEGGVGPVASITIEEGVSLLMRDEILRIFAANIFLPPCQKGPPHAQGVHCQQKMKMSSTTLPLLSCLTAGWSNATRASDRREIP